MSMLKKEWLSFSACIIITLLPALYNGFPLVTSDSGSYISNAFTLFIPSDRTITYSVFIRITSLAFSLWGVLIAQAVLLVFFLSVLARHFCKGFDYRFLLPAIILTTTCCSSAAWFCGQIMPDIFTAILLLATCVYFFVPATKKWHTGLLVFFIWGCIIMHNSHMLISLLLSLSLAIQYKRTRNINLFRRSLILLALSLTGFLTISTMNFISGKGFRPSASTHVFMMCRMVENGILDEFLKDNCATGEYRLCAYKDQLPDRQWDFMWNPNSPLYKTGGWVANEAEYSKIIRQTLTTPKYLAMHIYKSAEATFRQLSHLGAGDGNGPQQDYSDSVSVSWKINKYYRHEAREYRSSKQNDATLPFSFVNAIILLFALLSISSVLFISAASDKRSVGINEEWSGVFTLVLLYIFFNAVTTATFSTVAERFNARVFWVLPFFCILYLLNFFRKRSLNNNS